MILEYFPKNTNTKSQGNGQDQALTAQHHLQIWWRWLHYHEKTPIQEGKSEEIIANNKSVPHTCALTHTHTIITELRPNKTPQKNLSPDTEIKTHPLSCHQFQQHT